MTSKDVEPTPLQMAMAVLDALLTEKPMAAIIGQTWHKSRTFDEWVNDDHGEWYLSDGGYSRILIDEETGDLRIAPVSLDIVKQRWNNYHVRLVVRYIKRLYLDCLKEMEK